MSWAGSHLWPETFRRISDRPDEQDRGYANRGELQEANPNRRRDEHRGPRVRRDDGNVVRLRDQEVALKAIPEGCGHQDGEQPGGEGAVESQNRYGGDWSDQDHTQDERQICGAGDDLQFQMGNRVDEDYCEVPEDDRHERGVETVHGG